MEWRKEELGNEDYMPSQRDFHATIMKDNYFYVIGGSDKKVKLNEIHRFRIKEENPLQTIYKDLGRLVSLLYEEHPFSDVYIHIKDKEGEIKDKLYSYYPLLFTRAPKIIENAKEIESEDTTIFA
mmetsp:Transcript_27053/g.23897  ORF Transcript_27053/g.23897 Transcript_27053/m.23897 type:complete len:125 (+) Transcript_27053:915-1289(+)